MPKQSYLVRKGARYHFRRRVIWNCRRNRSISIALGTADPVEARRLVRRLAVKWDDLVMQMMPKIERGTLTLDEQEALFRHGLKDELARATNGLTAPTGATVPRSSHHSIMAAAYRIVARIPHDAVAIPADVFEAEFDKDWTDEDVVRLRQALRWLVTPMSVSRTDAQDALIAMGSPVSHGTMREARSQILRGYAEAHERAALASASQYDVRGFGASALLDDRWVQATRSSQVANHSPKEVPAAKPNAQQQEGNFFFAKRTDVRFGEQIPDLHDKLFEDNGWQPDNNKTLHMLEAFAWLTGDKRMSDYEPQDIDEYVRRMARIPKNFEWGRLHVSGGMAVPFDPAKFPKLYPSEQRSDRTINSHLSKMQSAAEILKKTYWLPRNGYGQVLKFAEARKRIVHDEQNPSRVPLGEDNLKALYGLTLWQGGGASLQRLKPSKKPTIFQDGAYWVPLLGTYAGMSREEACGLELNDLEFDAATPYMIVKANMTKSKDGLTPAGLKRPSRHRTLPIHPELLRLGFAEYVEAIKAEDWEMLFPELYGKIDRSGSYVRWKKPGGPRFYSIAWRYMIDAAHAIVPLPMASSGKKADFHSQRTFHYSCMAGESVSDALLARHVGHSQRTTGGRNYNRRALAISEEKELAERLAVMMRELPLVTSHVHSPEKTNLLHVNQRSRVGSAIGRNAANRFLA